MGTRTFLGERRGNGRPARPNQLIRAAGADRRRRREHIDPLPRILYRQYPRPAYTAGLPTQQDYRAAEEFLAWCTEVGVPSIATVQPAHVAAWIEASTRELAAPSVKQRLAALRHLFDGSAEARALLEHRYLDALGAARPWPDSSHRLFLRSHRRGARHAVEECLHAEDIAILTGGKVISGDPGIKLESVTLDMLGQSKRLRIEKENTRSSTALARGPTSKAAARRSVSRSRRPPPTTTARSGCRSWRAASR
jgi:hypothetical protein